MPLTANQIITQACQNANVPGFTAQAANLLNMILAELAQDYDFVVAMGTYRFNLPTNQVQYGGGTVSSTTFPADYLRAKKNECLYFISGVPYTLIPVDLDEFDRLVATPGLQNFPTVFATDMSQVPPVAYFWMPPSGSFAALLRYQRAMPDMADLTQVPWFPQQNYLLTRLTGELCKITDDERHTALLSYDEDGAPGGAGSVLRRFLRMKEDEENRTKTVQLDRRRFGSSMDRLRNTKTIGWVVPFTISLGGVIDAVLNGGLASCMS